MRRVDDILGPAARPTIIKDPSHSFGMTRYLSFRAQREILYWKQCGLQSESVCAAPLMVSRVEPPIAALQCSEDRSTGVRRDAFKTQYSNAPVLQHSILPLRRRFPLSNVHFPTLGLR